MNTHIESVAFNLKGTGMNIDTEFNVGDSVCYLSGDNIIHTSISKITIEISYEDDSFLMVYKLCTYIQIPILPVIPDRRTGTGEVCHRQASYIEK